MRFSIFHSMLPCLSHMYICIMDACMHVFIIILRWICVLVEFTRMLSCLYWVDCVRVYVRRWYDVRWCWWWYGEGIGVQHIAPVLPSASLGLFGKAIKRQPHNRTECYSSLAFRRVQHRFSFVRSSGVCFFDRSEDRKTDQQTLLHKLKGLQSAKFDLMFLHINFNTK